MRIPAYCIVILLTALVAACASSPAPRYFRLTAAAEPGPGTDTGTGTSVREVIIGPFQLAEYLDRPQIVSRDGENGMTVADFERWAEPLDANFQSVVTANVARLLGSDRVLEYPAQTILKPERRVTGRISRLDVDTQGRAVLELQWGVLDASGVAAAPGGRPGRRSRYEAQAVGAGYAAQVAAMNATVTAFSADVAAALQ
jgi:uncharacterized lipoprotein YmbA